VEARPVLEALVQQTPNDPALHQNLGNVYAMQSEPERAVQQYKAALQLSPTNNLMRESLAGFLSRNNKTEEAIAVLRQGLQIQPTASLYIALASIYVSHSNATEAVKVYHEGLQFKPDAPVMLNNLAWILATNPDDRVRDGAEAVRLAEKACTLSQYKQPGLIGTLAAAYAEAGRFSAAVTTAQKACDAASAAGNTALLKKNQELLELYRGGHAYREPSS
jgi:cytochrome c-type biogenesis protein CcmH/NrfG